MNANKRTINNIIIDSIGYISFWVLVSTGIMMKFYLLPGRSRGANDPTSIMGLGRHDWGDVHFWASMIFVAAIVIHLLLHWSWIVGVFNKMLNAKSNKLIIPALVLPIVLAFSPLFGAQGFGDDEEHSTPGRNRGGYYQNAAYSAKTQDVAVQASLQTDSFSTEVSGEEHQNYDVNGFRIRGRTTLKEIEQGTGISVKAIAVALNMPEDVPEFERMSVLKERYGLDMEKIRETVSKLASQ